MTQIERARMNVVTRLDIIDVDIETLRQERMTLMDSLENLKTLEGIWGNLPEIVTSSFCETKLVEINKNVRPAASAYNSTTELRTKTLTFIMQKGRPVSAAEIRAHLKVSSVAMNNVLTLMKRNREIDGLSTGKGVRHKYVLTAWADE